MTAAPPAGLPAELWARLVAAAGEGIAAADFDRDLSTPDDYAEAALQAVFAELAPTTGPRGRQAGKSLTEARTVLKRATTARQVIAGTPEWVRTPKISHGAGDMSTPPIVFDQPKFADPDQREMLDALDIAAALLAPWAKTGKTETWVGVRND